MLSDRFAFSSFSAVPYGRLYNYPYKSGRLLLKMKSLCCGARLKSYKGFRRCGRYRYGKEEYRLTLFLG